MTRDQDVRYFLGLPYRWQANKIFAGLWNKEDDRLLAPKYFGIGWTVNFHAVGKRLGLVKAGR